MSDVQMTPAQRNVRAALDEVTHELDGGEGAIVFVTRGYFHSTSSCMVIAVDPDGTVAGWQITHSWTMNGLGVQYVHAQPTHYDLAAQWMERWLAGEGDANCLAGRVEKAFLYVTLSIERTDSRPAWHITGVTRMQADWVNRDSYDAPHALAVGLDAVYGPDIPTATVTPSGRHHGQ